MPDTPLPPEFLTIPEYMRVSGDSRTTTYAKLADGRLRGIKDGRRTKITFRSAREHWDDLPEFEVKTASQKAMA
jgi:hypothetical protein